jgi:two-component sensor histidine kinase
LNAPHFLDGGGAMANAILDFDWSTTPLGPMSSWSVTLCITVGTMVSSKFPKCLFWGDARTLIYNDAYRPLLGEKPEALGRPLAVIWPEIIDEIEPLVAAAMAGEATFIEDHPLIIDRHGRAEHCWFTFCYSPVRNLDGSIDGMLNTVIETTEKVEAVRHARLLNEELAHRIRNTLAIVSAIAHQSYRSAGSKEAAQAQVSQRLAALGRAHAVLMQSSWHGAPIGAVVADALAPHANADQLVISGPAVRLSARQALALSLALHELATNALKYGALSTPAGRVLVEWTAGQPGGDQPFEFRWRETMGPRVQAPARRGFGLRLIKSTLAQDFVGEAAVDFCPDGVVCTVRTSMAMLGVDT